MKKTEFNRHLSITEAIEEVNKNKIAFLEDIGSRILVGALRLNQFEYSSRIQIIEYGSNRTASILRIYTHQNSSKRKTLNAYSVASGADTEVPPLRELLQTNNLRKETLVPDALQRWFDDLQDKSKLVRIRILDAQEVQFRTESRGRCKYARSFLGELNLNLPNSLNRLVQFRYKPKIVKLAQYPIVPNDEDAWYEERICSCAKLARIILKRQAHYATLEEEIIRNACQTFNANRAQIQKSLQKANEDN